MAIGYGFLTKGGFWTPKGHVIAAFAARASEAAATQFLELRQGEILCHLKYYLQAQGHLALRLGQLILEKAEVSEELLKREPLVEDWLVEAYRWALSKTGDLRERVELREKIKELSKGYDPDVRWHKLSPIIWPLVDFGMVGTSLERKQHGVRLFSAKYLGARRPLEALLSQISSFEALEREEKEGTLLRTIARAYNLSLSAPSLAHLRTLLGEAYLRVRMLPTGMASLAAMSDICTIRGILEFGTWIPAARVLSELESLQGKFPGGVRFQYDRTGHRSSVIVADEALTGLRNGGPSNLGYV